MEDPLPCNELIQGKCLLVDKPQGWTSFDVVNKIRSTIKQQCGVRKLKVGHAGTLDPLATGLLIICTGKKTKSLSLYQDMPKEYTGVMKLGAVSASYDAETEPEQFMEIDHLTEEQILEARKHFIGELEQYPPVYSAIKVDGQPLYKHARAGKEVEIQPRKVIIYELDITNITLPFVSFRVKCSKGTYIRSLAHDFGQYLGVGAFLAELRRTKIGNYSVDEAWNLEALIDAITTDPSISS